MAKITLFMDTEFQKDFELFQKKMEAAGCSPAAIRCFERSYRLWHEGESGLLPESQIEPATGLEELEKLRLKLQPCPELFSKLAILKLNGGLGTSMGLEKAKSLLVVRNGKTFLDLIVDQFVFLQKQYPGIRFFLLNSYNTSNDTRLHLERLGVFPSLDEIEWMQNRIPKVDLQNGTPAEWPKNPALEWCPPGHGDLYTVLGMDNRIQKLLDAGIEYLFVSNSDNLGATPDITLLTWLAQTHAPFLMEVTLRTPADKKGGHLAKSHGRLILRELAQCPEEDLEAFQDIHRHRYFNTNNIWIRLSSLSALLDKHGGFLPLPIIPNRKTLDPRDPRSPEVVQLETAMGAAIELFEGAQAVVVPRSRFSPVKTTSDLFALRSDAYEISSACEVRLVAERNGRPPRVELDENYKFIDRLEEALATGIPSLRECDLLRVNGKFQFTSDVIFRGQVHLENRGVNPVQLAPGIYENQTITCS